MTKLTTLIPFAAAALVLCSCTDGLDGQDGAYNSCSAKAIYKASSDTVLGYALACATSDTSAVLDTLWNGVSGVDGSSCTAKAVVSAAKDTTGYVLVCAGDTVGTIANGADGSDGADGQNCTASSLANGRGYSITCGDSTFSLLNGANGADGASCSVKDTTNAGLTGYAIVCGGTVAGVAWNGATGINGADGVSCSVKDTTKAGVSGYAIVCGGSVAGVVWNGVTGATGADGAGCTLTAAGDSIVKACGSDTLVTYKAWCGANHYNPDSSFCFGDTVIDYCNGQAYNPEVRACVGKNIEGTCGTQVYADTSSLNCKNDSLFFTDVRDATTYDVVVIGTQVWMAHDLLYTDSTEMKNLTDKVWVSPSSASSMAYAWTAAMNIDEKYLNEATPADTITSNWQGVCPTGWHVPALDEWNTLIAYAGGADAAGEKLRNALYYWNWDEDAVPGTDAYNLSVSPAGSRDAATGDFYNISSAAWFWTTSEVDATQASGVNMLYNSKGVTTPTRTKNSGLAIRCIKN